MNNKSGFKKSNWTVLLLFGLIGQIAWAVENMYFNRFVFGTISPDLDAITLMVQLSGVVATVATLVAGTLSDKAGNRRSFISWGYIIWGFTVAIFGFLSPELIGNLFTLPPAKAISLTLVLVIAGDCVMTLFGSTANDASFNAWVTDNTNTHNRGTVEGVLSILPLVAMLIVAGGFGILVDLIGYRALFLSLGVVISLSGAAGMFLIKASPALSPSGSMRDIFYGFRPSVVKSNLPLYITLLIILVYGIATQIFMPYLIIYMEQYLGFSTIEYSAVFAVAILAGAALNLYLTRLANKFDKALLLYGGAAIYALGLMIMYFVKDIDKVALLILFGIGGFVMISGNIFIMALTGALVRDYTPEGEAGKLQGVRMVFSVLIPMVVGPLVGNAINAARNIPIPDSSSEVAMTTLYIPAPEIFLAASLLVLAVIALIPLLRRVRNTSSKSEI